MPSYSRPLVRSVAADLAVASCAPQPKEPHEVCEEVGGTYVYVGGQWGYCFMPPNGCNVLDPRGALDDPDCGSPGSYVGLAQDTAGAWSEFVGVAIRCTVGNGNGIFRCNQGTYCDPLTGLLCFHPAK